MKKARLFLAAIAIVGVAGATMAFNVKQSYTYYTLNSAGTACNVASTTIQYTTTTGVGELEIFATPTARNFTSGVLATPCWKLSLTPSI